MLTKEEITLLNEMWQGNVGEGKTPEMIIAESRGVKFIVDEKGEYILEENSKEVLDAVREAEESFAKYLGYPTIEEYRSVLETSAEHILLKTSHKLKKDSETKDVENVISLGQKL